MGTHSEIRGDIDDAKIRAAALDYLEGWYTADSARMERCLHPDLAKRAYVPGSDGKPQFLHMSALILVQYTRLPKDSGGRFEVEILDRYEGIASVRTTTVGWVDYLHIAKFKGEWKIINILWEFTPEEWVVQGGIAGARV